MSAPQQILLAKGGLAQAPQVPFANVKLLLHGNGVDASTTITDQIGHTMTARGNAQIDTAQSVFGGASILFDGTGDVVDTPDSNDFTLGASDFTLEARIRFASGANTNGRTFLSHYDTLSNNRGWIWYYQNSGLEFVYNTNGTSSPGNVALNAAWAPADQTWYAIMTCRIGNTLYHFVDGTLIGTGSMTGVTVFNPVAEELRVGARASAGSAVDFMAGWMDEVRLTVGTGRSAVSYAVDTSAFPDS